MMSMRDDPATSRRNTAACTQFSTCPQSRQKPQGNKAEHEGTPGKAGPDFDGQKNSRRPPSTM